METDPDGQVTRPDGAAAGAGFGALEPLPDEARLVPPTGTSDGDGDGEAEGSTVRISEKEKSSPSGSGVANEAVDGPRTHALINHASATAKTIAAGNGRPLKTRLTFWAA